MPDLPYCGAAPLPGAALWNADPVLLLALVVLALLLAREARHRAGHQVGCSALGWGVLVLALVSPLCNLSVALFSARVGQHMLLLLVAAPLLAMGLRQARQSGVMLPSLAFAALLWAWHLPGPYIATFRSDIIYWSMHVTLLGAAIWLWRALLGSLRPERAALAALATAVQMGLLGALLTLAPRALFTAVHPDGVTAPWGLSPLEDQQLGGLLMWVPGGLAFALAAVVALGPRLMRPVLGRAGG